jgi:poly(3-hydroxybutyrate) depolymerase
VSPDGLPRPGAPPTSTNYFWADDVNVPYLNYVMDTLLTNAAIDRRRVYVIGFSAGAIWAFFEQVPIRLWPGGVYPPTVLR